METPDINENYDIKISSIDSESFIKCISFITGVDEGNFDKTLEVSSSMDWSKNYMQTLHQHGYDMLFYAFRDHPRVISDERPIERYQFPNLPLGTCIILCVDGAFNCYSVVGTTIKVADDNNNSKRLVITYDPNPDHVKKWFVEVGFFIKTFITLPENNNDNDEPLQESSD